MSSGHETRTKRQKQVAVKGVPYKFHKLVSLKVYYQVMLASNKLFSIKFPPCGIIV